MTPHWNSHVKLEGHDLAIDEDPRLSKNKVRVPRRDKYETRPLLSTTIHPDIKKTLVSMSERTGMTVSQVTDEVLYTGLVEMYELDEL